MLDFIKNFFETANFMPHGHCYLWKPEILWLHVISDLIIAIAYFSIPLTLVVLILKRHKFPLKWLIGLFAAFILLCGTSHIMGIVTQWNPLYRLEGVIKFITALVSIATAIAIIPVLPALLEGADQLAEKLENEENE